MMYKEEIQKEIKAITKEIDIARWKYSTTRIEYFNEFVKLRKRQLAAFKALLPKAKSRRPHEELGRKVKSDTTWRKSEV